jgi:ferrous iron transport protein A
VAFQQKSSLADLRVGERAIVKDVEGEGRMMVRLLEMGFVPGVEVALVKRAPLGDPLELRLRGYHVSLRKAEARAVVVEQARLEDAASVGPSRKDRAHA